MNSYYPVSLNNNGAILLAVLDFVKSSLYIRVLDNTRFSDG
jgi:hypothetical protein